MSTLDLPADIQQFLHQEVASGNFATEAAVVVAALRSYRDSDSPRPEEACDDAHDALNWDDMIPVPPDRPGGRLAVRFAKVGRDKPMPAEDPRAK